MASKRSELELGYKGETSKSQLSKKLYIIASIIQTIVVLFIFTFSIINQKNTPNSEDEKLTIPEMEVQINKLNSDIKTAKEERDGLQLKLSERDSIIIRLHLEIDFNKRQINRNKSIIDSCREALNRDQQEKSKLLRDLDVLGNQMRQIENDRNELRETNSTLENTKNELQSQLSELRRLSERKQINNFGIAFNIVKDEKILWLHGDAYMEIDTLKYYVSLYADTIKNQNEKNNIDALLDQLSDNIKNIQELKIIKIEDWNNRRVDEIKKNIDKVLDELKGKVADDAVSKIQIELRKKRIISDFNNFKKKLDDLHEVTEIFESIIKEWN